MDKALASILAWWESAGVDTPDIKPAAPVKPTAPAVSRAGLRGDQRPAPQTRAVAAPIPETPQSSTLAAKAKNLEELKHIISEFNAGEMSDYARQAVFSRGNPNADIMVIGEAPGRDEDLAGKPFVGPAGQLLDKIFASIGLDESTLYLTTAVNWYPPAARNPSREEIDICRPFLNRHIELVDPKIIVLVGGVSLTSMTGRSGIMKNRGQWTELTVGAKTIPALPIYHPAFLLKQPSVKKDCWRDMLSLRERIAELA